MTANSFAEDVQASLDAGMNAHLLKPIVIDEVIKTILRYVHFDKEWFVEVFHELVEYHWGRGG